MVDYDEMEVVQDGYRPLGDDDDDEENVCTDFILPYQVCPHCANRLLIVQGEGDWEEDDFQVGREFELWYCRNCRFWQSRIISALDGHCMPGPQTGAYVAKLRKFDPALPNDCASEIAQHIRRKPEFLHTCHPTHLEKLVVEVFRYNYDHADVIHVGKTDDGGIDVLLIDAEKSQWLIQVKRRESEQKSEGVRTIREMIGTMFLEGALKGIVVSSSRRFTKRAKLAAARASAKGMHIGLVDKGILNRMLDPLLPDRPWLPPVTRLDDELSRMLAAVIDTDNQMTMFPEFEFGSYRIDARGNVDPVEPPAISKAQMDLIQPGVRGFGRSSFSMGR